MKIEIISHSKTISISFDKIDDFKEFENSIYMCLNDSTKIIVHKQNNESTIITHNYLINSLILIKDNE